jgi:malonyl-CoA/methylmalonyl-CoA synthetase
MAPISLDDPTPSGDMLAAWSKHVGRPVDDPKALHRGLTRGPTLPAAFSAVSRRHLRAAALTLGDTTLTHGEVEEESARVAGLMAAWGVGPGTRLTLLAEPEMSVVLTYLAALRSGAVVTLAHPSYTPYEIGRTLSASGAELAVGTGESLRRLVESDPDLPVLGVAPADREATREILADRPPARAPRPNEDGESTAILAFTSGTTGEPKPVPLSHRSLLASIRGVMLAWRWRPDDRLVHCLPIAHQHGLGAIHIALLTGSHAVILPSFEPAGLIEVLSNEDATALFAVPAIYDRLLTEVPTKVASLSRLRLMTSGSAPLPAELGNRIEHAVGELPVERYGLTETGLDVSNPFEGPRIAGTVGIALPGVELAVVDDAGKVLGLGETGEVILRGPQVFDGYPEDGGEGFIGDWFRTGDIGTVEEESGHLRLVGRSKEVIITGGVNVYPREVEAALLALSGVVDAAVIGVPSHRWGEAVTAFVVASGISIEEIGSRMESVLAPFKRPKQIIAVESIPRTELGKIRRDLLAALTAIDRS